MMVYFIQTLRELGVCLEKEIWDADLRRKIFAHEESHAQEGIRRGYNPRFSLRIWGEMYNAKTIFYEDVEDVDLMAIALAPNPPSIEDLKLALEIKKRLRWNY